MFRIVPTQAMAACRADVADDSPMRQSLMKKAYQRHTPSCRIPAGAIPHGGSSVCKPMETLIKE
jgi:hypothetical protein